MFDFHMHTTVSYDGQSTPQQMAQAALNAGLREICFTDHLDYTRLTPREQTCFQVEDYEKAYGGLHLPGLQIRKGVEAGLAPWNVVELGQDLAKQQYDFVLGSVHFIADEDPYFPEFWVGKTAGQVQEQYFAEMLRCVELHDNFDVLGHLTYISKLSSHPVPHILPLEQHRDIIARIMEMLIQKGKGMEINTSGMDRCGDYLPGEPYLRLFKDLGGSIVTVGSDAHRYDRVGQYTSDACALAGKIFGHVCTFQNREPVFHKL